jgi:hypothetical protein
MVDLPVKKVEVEEVESGAATAALGQRASANLGLDLHGNLLGERDRCASRRGSWNNECRRNSAAAAAAATTATGEGGVQGREAATTNFGLDLHIDSLLLKREKTRRPIESAAKELRADCEAISRSRDHRPEA